MAMTATEFRKNLFQVLDSVAKGRPAEIEYKGTKLSIKPVAKRSIFDNLVERDLGWDIKDNESGWTEEMQAAWDKKWSHYLPAKPKSKAKR